MPLLKDYKKKKKMKRKANGEKKNNKGSGQARGRKPRKGCYLPIHLQHSVVGPTAATGVCSSQMNIRIPLQGERVYAWPYSCPCLPLCSGSTATSNSDIVAMLVHQMIVCWLGIRQTFLSFVKHRAENKKNPKRKLIYWVTE